MKKFAAFVVGMSMSTLAFAGGPELQVSCYEQVLSVTGKVKETHNLYRGKMPLGTLRLASKADAHNKKEYHLDFTANGAKGGQLEIVIPAPATPAPSQEQQGQGKDQSQCQMPVEEIIPGECYEIAPPAPEKDCSQQDQGQAQQQGCTQQSQGQAQQQGSGCAQQSQGQSQQQGQGTCEQTPAAPVDMAHVKLSADKKVSFTAIDAADSSGASLEASGTASLKIDHHRGHLGLKVVTTCDVQYSGGL